MECMTKEEEAALKRVARNRKKKERQRAKRKHYSTCNDVTFATGGPHDEDEGPARNAKKPKLSLKVKKRDGATKTVQRTPQSTSSGDGRTRQSGRREADRASLQRQPSTAAGQRGRSWRTQGGRGRPREGDLGNTATAGYPGHYEEDQGRLKGLDNRGQEWETS